ncbi:MAG: hypothetical protein AAGA68_09300 [Pseudomonadota bacterium]
MNSNPIMRSSLGATALALTLASNLADAGIGNLAVDIDPMAFGTPTVEIFVNGPFGGDIEWTASGEAVPFPDGACGFRVKGNNLLEWGWYEGGVAGNDFMNGVNNNGLELPHVPNEWLEFTGPYGDNCEEGYVFHTPATPTSLPPAGAIKLVIQFVDWDDIEFLTAGFQPFEVQDGLEPPDEPPPLCEIVPEFCEPVTDELVFDGGCDDEIVGGCDDGEEGAEHGALTTFSAGWNVRGTVQVLALPNVPLYADLLIPLSNARDYAVAAQSTSRDLIEFAESERVSREESLLAARFANATDLAERKLETCTAAVERALYETGRGMREEAVAQCEEAAMQLYDAHESAQAFARLRSHDRKAVNKR